MFGGSGVIIHTNDLRIGKHLIDFFFQFLGSASKIPNRGAVTFGAHCADLLGIATIMTFQMSFNAVIG